MEEIQKVKIIKRILILGVKEFPYGASSNYEKFSGGGIAKVVLALINELEKQEIEFYLVVRRMPNQQKKEKRGNINIYRTKWINNKYLRLPSLNFFGFIKALSLMKHIDIIHAHDKFAIYFGIILSKIFKKPLLASPHGGPLTKKSLFNPFATFLYRKLEKYTMQKSDTIVFLSEAEREQLLGEYKIKRENNFVIPTGITPLQISKKETSKFIVLFIGRVVARKGLDKFIRSFSYLPKKIQQKVEYYIVGDGIELKSLKQLSMEYGFSKNILFPGFTNDIKPFLEIADIFILPSEGGEGLPISVLEAMSVGIPSILSNFTAPFRDDSYINIKNNNPETIAEVIGHLYKDKDDLIMYSKNALNEFKKYSIEIAAKNYRELYLKF